MTRYTIAVVAIAALMMTLTSHTASAADWGNLNGRFIYDGAPPKAKPIDTSKEAMCAKHNVVDESIVVGKDGGLANVVIFVSSKKVKVNPEYESSAKDTVVLDNHGCRFEPHVLAMRVTQPLEVKNTDAFSHNSNISPLGDQAENFLLAPDSENEFHFHKVQKVPVKVQCNIHPWMNAYIVVKDNPYIAVSDKDGNFELKDLPAEELEFTAWHEASGWLAAKSGWDKKGVFKMKIKPGDNDLGTIKVNPKLLEKK